MRTVVATVVQTRSCVRFDVLSRWVWILCCGSPSTFTTQAGSKTSLKPLIGRARTEEPKDNGALVAC